MSPKKKPSSSRKVSFSREEIASVAEKVRAISGDIESVLKQPGMAEFEGELEIDGGKMIYEGMGWLSEFAGKLNAAFRRQPSTAKK